MKKMKRTVSLILIMSLMLISLAGCSDGRVESKNKLSEEDAAETLNALLTKVDVNEINVSYDLEGADISNDLASELPDISSYDLVVKGTGDIDIELFSSTEKAVDNETDGWLIKVANNFNKQQYEIDGNTISVSVRSIASGTAADYITSGKYVPDAFLPSNVLWGNMIESNGIPIELVEDRIAGNTAGILISKNTYDRLFKDKKDITLNDIVNETLKGNMLLGYTNPYVSSTGLNVLINMMLSFDSKNPLSEDSINKLEELQANIPSVSYTTAQMRETARKGLLDAMVMEYQAYINTPELKNYVFVPFGVRHDNPVYAMESCTGDKREVLELFVEYCLNKESQDLAAKCGFNEMDEYSNNTSFTGEQLYSVQEIWKKKKDAGQPVVAVFVTDVSGSMEGTPITELKSSLLNAANYIGEDNYIGLVSYSNDVYINLPIGQFNNKQKAGFNGAIKQLSANGGTSTYDAVLVASKMLLDAKEEVPNAKLMMFVLSDGEQTDGYNYTKVEPVIEGLRIPIHSICYGESISEMEQMSSLNEASVIRAEPEDVVYNLKNVFNAQL